MHLKCLCLHVWMHCVLADLLLPRPWEWGQSDRTDSLFPNTSVWPAASHTFHYFQTDFQKQESKGIEVVKTWHSQKRAVGPWDYTETSHMTQLCRNYSTARVDDEGPLIDIVLLKYPPFFSISVLLFHHAFPYIRHSFRTLHDKRTRISSCGSSDLSNITSTCT